jgi:hypothetical protein
MLVAVPISYYRASAMVAIPTIRKKLPEYKSLGRWTAIFTMERTELFGGLRN